MFLLKDTTIEPAALRSRVKHSTTEPLRSPGNIVAVLGDHGRSYTIHKHAFAYIFEPEYRMALCQFNSFFLLRKQNVRGE